MRRIGRFSSDAAAEHYFAAYDRATGRTRWLDDVLAALELPRVHLVGASSGGCYAVYQAIHRPGRLASVAAVDPTTVTARFRPAVLWWSAVGVLVRRDRVWARILAQLTGVPADRPDMRLVLAGIRDHRPRLPPQLRPAQSALRRIEGPMLLVFLEKSTAHNARRAARRSRRLLRTAEVELWLGRKHTLSLEVADRVLEFTTACREVRLPRREGEPLRALRLRP
ncbi:alpha/beta fold hydrolase [Amycolatopsis sacchari]|uniref:alpha/beta fold hydrolase n=1 Tax=Amycolatopsis sacchari TaxID=115433 RepID=UPI003D71FC2B